MASNQSLAPHLQWCEFVPQADAFWNHIRGVLINFVAFDERGRPVQLGTGFVVGVLHGGYVVVLTAKHVIEEGNLQTRSRKGRRAPNAPSILFDRDKPSISPNDMVGLWMSPSGADVLTIKYMHYADSIDIAVCILQFQEPLRPHLPQIIPKVAIDLKLPSVGDEVYLVALSQLHAERVSDDGHGTFEFASNAIIRAGRVKSVETKVMGHNAGAFTTTIPVSGGMSGGFVYVPRLGPVGACGVVSSSEAGSEFITDFGQQGNSTVVGILGALGLRLPTELHDEAPWKALLHFVHSGEIEDLSGSARWLRWEHRIDDDSVLLYPAMSAL